ncbi:TPA: hypothetical protein ACFNM3_002011 [Neisseria lactamica]|uniref:hypothetical protein n=1 Tax=Neisseria lactamica TaxID=486 RepID=UPI001864C72E|nr:hypothetical protein [Neisseria lactamica]
MTKSCGQQRNDEVSNGIVGFVELQTASSSTVIPAQAGIQNIKSKETVLPDKFPCRQT